jgi:hypothetical protein
MADKFQADPIKVPSLAEISNLYRSAVDAKDDNLRMIAENAALRLAAAEAAAAESATMVSFYNSVRK